VPEKYITFTFPVQRPADHAVLTGTDPVTVSCAGRGMHRGARVRVQGQGHTQKNMLAFFSGTIPEILFQRPS